MISIACRDLTKVYGDKSAIKDVSFDIQENTITGIIGRNGAGKSTLLKIISGLIKESSGEIKVFSKQPFNNLKVSANTIFLDDRMVFPMTMNLEEILHACEMFYENWDMELAKGLFNYFFLNKDAYYQQLSKGMKTTFNMIVGLSSRCALTIFDEPTSGMDRAVRQDFYRAILKDYMDYPRTILLSSHLLNEMESLLENILLIKNGKVFFHKAISELKEYATGIEGPTEIIQEWVKNKEILHMKSIGPRHSYTVVQNNFTDYEWDVAKQKGLKIAPVLPDDLCVYLTSNEKGGIDSVFDRGSVK